MFNAVRRCFIPSSNNDVDTCTTHDRPQPDSTARRKTDAQAASLEDTKAALDAVAAKSGFRCVPVSWEDAQRGTVGGALSCWGGNISDVRLWAKDGTLLYTLRTENWNERLGYVASKDVAVIVGSHVPGGSPYTPITLQRFLKEFGTYASYAGVTSDQLWDEVADQLLSVRFQAVFLPIKDEETSEFCTEVYNYNAHSDDDPRNVNLLCTAQGTSVQQDGSGAKKVFIHSVDGAGKVHRYWLEAERSKHKVGGAQEETDEEAAAAAARGKATAMHIGTKEMGTRFNVQMLIQVPLRQKSAPNLRSYGAVCMNDDDDEEPELCCEVLESPSDTKAMECSALLTSSAVCDEEESSPCVDDLDIKDVQKCCEDEAEEEESTAIECDELVNVEADGDAYDLPMEQEKESMKKEEACEDKYFAEEAKCSKKKKMMSPSLSLSRRREASKPKPKPKVGTANAARVSRGAEHDTWAGVANKAPERDPSQHATITVTLYYTVAGGVPSPEDVEACVADLDALYKACPSDKKLVDCGEITAELTVKAMQDIATKVTTQPYVPPPQAPVKSGFPVDE